MVVCRFLVLAFLSAAGVGFASARAVNISSVWLLPEEGFPVFYRYFRDRITWFEADAVCQFHHANLVTVDSSEQYDATRAYLKELDVVNNVWVGLKRSGSEGEFTWTDYKPLENGGYWQEQIPLTDSPVCAALDPAADFRWHPLSCGGPEVASFICQLEVPAWARKEDGCMLTSLPSLTVTYLPEQGAVELISDCGLEGTRRIACKGQANREEMMKQLSCESSTEGQTEATSSNTWDNELPTRHRRDTDVTVDMASAQHLVPTTEGLTEANSVEVTNDSPPAKERKESLIHTNVDADVTSTQGLPQEMSAAEEPIKSSVDLLTDETSSSLMATSQNVTSPLKNPEKELFDERPIQVPLNSISRIASEEASSSQAETKLLPGDRRMVAVQSKPIPPSLRGNSPFIEPTPAPNKTELATDTSELTTQKPVEKESHEVFRESKADITLHPDKQEAKGGIKSPVSMFGHISDRDPDESSSRVQGGASHKEHEETSGTHSTTGTSKDVQYQESDSKFFTRVIADETTSSTASPVPGTKTTGKPNTDNDFFIVTESPLKIVASSSTKLTPSVLPESPELNKESDAPVLTENTDDLTRSSAFSTDQEMADEAEPEVPERPNRGRLLIRPQHHSFYPYFLNRVLG